MPKKVSLKVSLKTAFDEEILIWSGSLFQSHGAATEKALFVNSCIVNLI